MLTTEIVNIEWQGPEGQWVLARCVLLGQVDRRGLIIKAGQILEWNRESDPDHPWSDDLETRNQEFRDWVVATEQYQLALDNFKLRLLGPDEQVQP